jgi:hypothetical protein
LARTIGGRTLRRRTRREPKSDIAKSRIRVLSGAATVSRYFGLWRPDGGRLSTPGSDDEQQRTRGCADLLIEAGYPEAWVNAKAAHVSSIYYHHRRPGPKAPKDGAGIAVYGPEDKSGLLDVARELKDGNGDRPDGSAAPACDNQRCSM